jgi:hypothetical protein
LLLLEEKVENGLLTTEGDGAESHTEDTVHLGSSETDSLEFLDKAEVDSLSNEPT